MLRNCTACPPPPLLHITQYLPALPFPSYVADALDLDGRPWINQWLLQVEKSSDMVKVPAEAIAITSPLIVQNWSNLLETHPDQSLVNFFLAGISQGFCIGYHNPGILQGFRIGYHNPEILQGFRIGYHNPQSSLKSAKRNLVCALQHPEVVDHYLEEELALKRVTGPFLKELVPEVHINRFGVITKRHQPGKRHLIVDLSHLSGHSVNEGIPKSLCSLSISLWIRLLQKL